MKKIAALIFMLSFLLQSCDKDEAIPEDYFTTVGVIKELTISFTDVKINDITNQVGNYVSEVALVARVLVPATAEGPANIPDGEDGDYRYMLRMPFNAEGMTIRFPENPPQALIRNIEKDFPEGFTISDRTANTIAFVEIACHYTDSDRISGKLDYRKDIEGGPSYEVHYIYSDRAVQVTGTSKDWWGHTTTYNIKLEKGWNMIVEKTEYINGDNYKTYTHFLPTGMAWYYNMLLGGRG